MERVKIGIIGIGGFAQTHVASAMHCEERGLCELGAIVARLPHNDAYREAERESELRARGVRIYRSYEELLDGERGRIELVTVPLGIPLHAAVSIAALEAGYHVLCEKPAAGSAADARRMADAQRKADRILSIGYQHLLTGGIQALKRAALERRYGRLLEARTIIRWPRDSAYYARNEWAGKLSLDGRPVLDSPAQNAAAHFLQNMLYVAGGSADDTARPIEVYGENYRANAIESADTQFVRVRTDTEVTITFVASHALTREASPYSEFSFERATVLWDTEQGARLSGEADGAAGETTALAAPDPRLEGYTIHDFPFVDVLDAVRGGGSPKSSVANALQHVAVVESAFASSGGVHPLPGELVTTIDRPRGSSGAATETPVTLTVFEGMEELLERCFAERRGPAELGLSWGKAGRSLRPTP